MIHARQDGRTLCGLTELPQGHMYTVVPDQGGWKPERVTCPECLKRYPAAMERFLCPGSSEERPEDKLMPTERETFLGRVAMRQDYARLKTENNSLREQLRLATIDQANTEAELNEARKDTDQLLVENKILYNRRMALEAELTEARKELEAERNVRVIVARVADGCQTALEAHRRFHGKVGCPGPPECYVCETDPPA